MGVNPAVFCREVKDYLARSAILVETAGSRTRR